MSCQGMMQFGCQLVTSPQASNSSLRLKPLLPAVVTAAMRLCVARALGTVAYLTMPQLMRRTDEPCVTPKKYIYTDNDILIST